MPSNIYNQNKLSKSMTDQGSGIPTENGPQIGVVMDNHDPTRNGRVQVWLKTRTSKHKNNKAYWRTVSYLSPFYGTTPHKMHDESDSKFDQNGHSYGMWFTSPDVGVEVLCFFVNGDPNLGFYVGYVPQPQMNHMVPATGARPVGDPAETNTAAEDAAFAKAKQLPTVELSKSDKNMNNARFYDASKPVHTVLATQMWKQGTLTDNIRGPIGSSVQRESPSYAYGISTPGRPVYSGGLHEANGMTDALKSGNVTKDDVKVEARRGGHSFVMDDGDIDGNDVLMRFRTSSGHQITMSDDGAAIYIQHSNGLTWIELGNEGTVDIFSSNSINLRSQGQLNFHADENINFFSGKDIKMYAKENIKMECEKNFDLIGKQKWEAYSEQRVFLKSDNTLATQSANKTSIGAGKNIVAYGKNIMLNTDQPDKVKKPAYITPTNLPDTEVIGPTGWNSIPGNLRSIVTRAPTHEPYAEHNKGVPVPVKIGNPGVPPAATVPSATSDKLNSISANNPIENPIEVSTVADQSNLTGNIKEIGSMDKATVLSTMTQQANNLSQAVDEMTDKGFGKFGVQLGSLPDLGVIKQGVLDATNMSPSEMYEKLKDPALFAGLNGVNSLTDLANEQIQSGLVQQGMGQAYSVLKQAGTLLGSENATDLASVLGTSMVAAPGEIIDWATNAGEASLNGAMDLVAKGSEFASNLAASSGNAVLSGLLDNVKIGKTALAIVDNVDFKAFDGMADSILGNVKLPSVSQISAGVKSSLSGLSLDSFTSIDTGIITDNLSEFTPSAIAGTLGEGLESLSDIELSDVTNTIGDGIDAIANVDLSKAIANLPINKTTELVTNFAKRSVSSIVDKKLTNTISKVTRFI